MTRGSKGFVRFTVKCRVHGQRLIKVIIERNLLGHVAPILSFLRNISSSSIY